MALDPVAFKQTKHILRAAEFLRDLVARCVFTFAHTPGATMMADILTKAVVRPLFIELFKLIEKYAADGLAVPSSALLTALQECSCLLCSDTVSSQEGLSERLVHLYVCAYTVCEEVGATPFWLRHA